MDRNRFEAHSVQQRPLTDKELSLEKKWLKKNSIEVIPTPNFKEINYCEPAKVLLKAETYRGLNGRTKIFLAQDETKRDYGR
jgi:hypothetical protein